MIIYLPKNFQELILLPNQKPNTQYQGEPAYRPQYQSMPLQSIQLPVPLMYPQPVVGIYDAQLQQQFAHQNFHYNALQNAYHELQHQLFEAKKKSAEAFEYSHRQKQRLDRAMSEIEALHEENKSLKRQITGVQPVRFNEEDNHLQPLSAQVSVPKDATGFEFENAVLSLPSQGLDTPHFLQTLRPRIERGEESHLYFQQFVPHIMEEIRAGLHARLLKIQQQKLRTFSSKLQIRHGGEVVLTEVGDYLVEINCMTSTLVKLDHDFSCEAVWLMVPEDRRIKKIHSQDVSEGVLAIASVSNQKHDGEKEMKLLMLKSDYETYIDGWKETPESLIQMHWLYGLLPLSRMFQACLNTPPLFLEQSIIHGELQSWPLEHASEKCAAAENSQPVVSQRYVVENLASARSGLYCLQGPPGTGKTTLLANLMERWVTEFPQERILMCAPSNPATQVILRKVKSLLPDVAIAWIGVGRYLSDDIADVSVSQFAEHLCAPLLKMQSNQTERLLDGVKYQYDKIHQALMGLEHERNIFVKPQLKEKVLALKRFVALEQQKLEQAESWSDDELLESISQMIDNLKTNANTLGAFLVQRAQIVFSTLVASGRESLKNQVRGFDRLVVDEAAQALALETLIPFRFNPKVCLLVGDPKQLPATIESGAAKQAGFDKSLLTILTEDCQQPYPILGQQFRMHPEICLWPSKQYYSGQLNTDLEVLRHTPFYVDRRFLKPFNQTRCFFNIHSGRESKDVNNSYFNRAEALALAKTVVYLLKQGLEPGKIGVITFYAAQVSLILEFLRTRLEKTNLNGLTVNTVDSFQGGEREAILISSVRSNQSSVGFLNDGRRINVAMTRAKSALYLFGNGPALQRSSSDLRAYINELPELAIVDEAVLNSSLKR